MMLEIMVLEHVAYAISHFLLLAISDNDTE